MLIFNATESGIDRGVGVNKKKENWGEEKKKNGGRENRGEMGC
jgi:hypothetical protein